MSHGHQRWLYTKHFKEDSDDEKSSLEQRVDQLTVTVEKLQREMQEQRREKDEAARDNEKRAKNNEENNLALKMDLVKQMKMHKEEMLKWGRERVQLLQQLDNYKLQARKHPTDNSSTQTIEKPPPNNRWKRGISSALPIVSRSSGSYARKSTMANYGSQSYTISCSSRPSNLVLSQIDGIKPYKCIICGNSYRHKLNLIRHREACQPENPNLFCYYCDQGFSHPAEFESHMENTHGSCQSDNRRMNSAITVQPSGKMIPDRKTFEELECKPRQRKEDKQQREQKIEVFANTFENTLQISSNQQGTTPSAIRNDHQSREIYRNNVMSLIDRHRCDRADCLMLRFKDSIDHAKACTLGADCQLFICKQRHLRSEHLKVCDMNCSKCSAHRYFSFKEFDMVSLVHLECTVSTNAPKLGNLTDAALNFYVNYGLADVNDEANAVAETQSLTEAQKSIENVGNQPDEDDEAAGWDLLHPDIQCIEILEHFFY